ncbi:unnamed protein product [Haemonchus placei]|uniref:Uncharacterized protein n=1 Tax=Haemonchus placei TaxID=6290 RepID=A0A3P8BP16_HAEPC|nr:unnamed protein product [Haemonchus placei]
MVVAFGGAGGHGVTSMAARILSMPRIQPSSTPS